MRWPRMTTRHSMLAVLGVAVALGLGLPAVEVVSDRDEHLHGFFHPYGDPSGSRRWCLGTGVERRRSPFWARYRRCLLGQSWKRRPFCGPGDGRVGETCEYDRPDLAVWDGPGHLMGYFKTPPVWIEGAGYLDKGDLLPDNWTPRPIDLRR